MRKEGDLYRVGARQWSHNAAAASAGDEPLTRWFRTKSTT